MTRLELQSERNAATGNLASAGIRNQLGRPRLDALQVLVREAFQNSWDAHDTARGQVRAAVDGWIATKDQIELLSQRVFAELPQKGLSLEPLLRQGLTLLSISDRGTTGLGGPTRADCPRAPGESGDFVGFLRNIGSALTKELGGGTFGYGKAIFYNVSVPSTICVYTRCTYRGESTSRFIAAGLGGDFQIDQGASMGQYTGRHWWGRLDDLVVEPVLGVEADALANGLNMDRDFELHEHGTTILIIAPRFGERTPVAAMRFMAEAILWNFWPKMLPGPTGVSPMQFFLSWNDEEVSLPAPAAYPPLNVFVEAMKRLKAQDKGACTAIESLRPKRHLGVLALVKRPTLQRKRLALGEEVLEPIGPLAHHVALMRHPELVVRYVAGPQLATDMMEYGGVFLVDEALDRVFAQAEPPTHDDWVADNLEERHHKVFVRVASKRIDEVLKEYVAPTLTQPEQGAAVSVGKFASALGGLLTGALGPSATVLLETESGSQPNVIITRTRDDRKDKDAGKSGGPGVGGESEEDASTAPRKTWSSVRIADGHLTLVDDIPVFRVVFSVRHGSEVVATEVQVTAGAELDDSGLEKDPPAGGAVPRVIAWRDHTGRLRAGATDTLRIDRSEGGKWSVDVQIVDDAKVQTSLTARGCIA